MRVILSCCLILAAAYLQAAEPKAEERPITEANGVLAVYYQSQGLAANRTDLVFAAWPDGKVVWAKDEIAGGVPFRTGRIEPARVTELLSRMEDDGLFADEKLNQPNLGPDSAYLVILIRSGKKQVKLESWHELFEASGKLVVDHSGLSRLEGRQRLAVLRKTPADYLYYRFVWSETRNRLKDLFPLESRLAEGELVVAPGGLLSWKETAAK